MKKRDLNLILLFIIGVFFYSCSDSLESEIGESIISKEGQKQELNIPFEDVAVLDSYLSDSKIINYNKARKVALTEMIGTEIDKSMGWEGHKLSTYPVVYYGFDGKPKLYDFIILDAEGKMVGTVTTYARKSASTIVKSVSNEIKDYGKIQSKVGSNSSLYVDWAGNSYIGVRGKSGLPDNNVVVNAETGESVSGVKEATDSDIIKLVSKELLPEIMVKDFSVYDGVNALENEDFKEEVEMASKLTPEVIADSMRSTLNTEIKNAELFWNEVESENIENLTDDQIINESSKFLGRLFRRIFSGVDSSTRYLDRYVNSGSYTGTSGTKWCGPWACGYILYANQKVNKYTYFENCASTVGEFGILNFTLRLLGRPMTPAEMSWSMPIASSGKIHISPFLWFADLAAYDQIKHYKKPALRLCSKGGGLHWTVAYGTYQTGNYFWRNYYFLQQDNSSQGQYKNPTNKSNYSRVDWWNPWLMVWD